MFNFSIHPRTKADIGYRLSRAGLAVAYKQNVEYLGPIVSSVVLSSDKTTIEITYGNVTSIEFRNSAGFEVDMIIPNFSIFESLYILRYAVVKNCHV
jgi:hypothetical protein